MRCFPFSSLDKIKVSVFPMLGLCGSSSTILAQEQIIVAIKSFSAEGKVKEFAMSKISYWNRNFAHLLVRVSLRRAPVLLVSLTGAT